MKTRTKELEETVQRLEWRLRNLEKSTERTGDFFGRRIEDIENKMFNLQPREFIIDGGSHVNVEALLLHLAAAGDVALKIEKS